MDKKSRYSKLAYAMMLSFSVSLIVQPFLELWWPYELSFPDARWGLEEWVKSNEECPDNNESCKYRRMYHGLTFKGFPFPAWEVKYDRIGNSFNYPFYLIPAQPSLNYIVVALGFFVGFSRIKSLSFRKYIVLAVLFLIGVVVLFVSWGYSIHYLPTVVKHWGDWHYGVRN